MLAVFFALQKPVHELGSFVGIRLAQELADLGRRRQLARYIDVDSPNKLFVADDRRWFQVRPGQFGVDETIDFAMGERRGGNFEPLLARECAGRDAAFGPGRRRRLGIIRRQLTRSEDGQDHPNPKVMCADS